jgi:hypothetical protein
MTRPKELCPKVIIIVRIKIYPEKVIIMRMILPSDCNAQLLIQRVSVNTHKTLNFTVYININYNRYNISSTVRSHNIFKMRIQVGGTTPRYNPTILIHVSTLS